MGIVGRHGRPSTSDTSGAHRFGYFHEHDLVLIDAHLNTTPQPARLAALVTHTSVTRLARLRAFPGTGHIRAAIVTVDAQHHCVLASLAELERRVGNLRRAAALGHESLSLARATHDDSLVATILNNLGSVATARGDWEEAAMLLDSAVVVFVTLGDQHVVAECCQRLAVVANLRELGTLAARLLGVSSALRELVGGVMFPDERAEYERGVAGARALIGDAAYALAWADGHAMPLERVLADARASLIRVQSA